MSSRPVIVEFDGSSKGNPGRSGAGAVIRSEDGTVLARAQQGMGHATNNEAEYGGFKLGLQTAHDMGYENVRVRGDSELITKQVRGEWKTRNENMARNCGEARDLMSRFKSCDVDYVPRGYNSAADGEANKAVNLPDGEVYKESTSRHSGGRYGGRYDGYY